MQGAYPPLPHTPTLAALLSCTFRGHHRNLCDRFHNPSNATELTEHRVLPDKSQAPRDDNAPIKVNTTPHSCRVLWEHDGAHDTSQRATTDTGEPHERSPRKRLGKDRVCGASPAGQKTGEKHAGGEKERENSSEQKRGARGGIHPKGCKAAAQEQIAPKQGRTRGSNNDSESYKGEL